MYIIIASFLIVIFIFFWQTIYTVISSYASNSLKSSNSIIGNMWFICLLIINLCLIIFIYGFYYYKVNTPGNTGNYGDKGFDGERGEPCYIKDSSCKFSN